MSFAVPSGVDLGGELRLRSLLLARRVGRPCGSLRSQGRARRNGGVRVISSVHGRIDPAIAAHEARHAAAALLLGLDVKEARADNPSPDTGGYVMLGDDAWRRPREHAIMTLVGRWDDLGWPPEYPSKSGRTEDERQLADEVESIGRGRPGYEDLLVDTRRLVQRPDCKSLVDVLEELLARGCVLREDHIRLIHEACGKPELEHKTVKATARTTTDLGEFTALAAAWSKDRQAIRSSAAPSPARSRRGGNATARSRCTGHTRATRST